MRIRRPMCLICTIFLIVVYFAMRGRPPAPSWDVDAYDGRTITLTGKISDRQEKGGTLQIYLTCVEFSNDDHPIGTDKDSFPKFSKGIVVKITDYGSVKKYVRLGATLRVRGVFAPFEKPMNEGQFDSRSYYMIRGYEGQLKRAKIIGVSNGYSYLREKLRRFRDASATVIEENMSEQSAGAVAAMTLGDKTELDAQIKELYQNAGISHVLALSGLHIASVGLCILKLLRKIGVKSAVAAVLSGLIVVTYAVMTGLSTSTLRAMIMFALAIIAMIIGRTYDLLSAAALSAILIVIENPGYLFDTGFLLSFGAILAIGCAFPTVDGLMVYAGDIFAGALKKRVYPGLRLSGKKGKKKRFKDNVAENKNKNITEGIKKKLGALRQGICVSLSVNIVTLPIVANSYFQVPRFSILLNLIIIPLMSVVLATGFAGIGVGLLGKLSGSWMMIYATKCVFKITEAVLNIYEFLSVKATGLNSNLSIFGRPSKVQIIVYAVCVIAATVLGNRVIAEDKKAREDNLKTNSMPFIDMERSSKSWHGFVYCLVSAALFLSGIFVLKFHPLKDLEIRNIYVGQGDCALITGRSMPVIVIDGGSSDIKSVGKYNILPVLKSNAISTIDYCFITHTDNDHISGILEILEDRTCGVRIRNVVLSQCAYVDLAEKLKHESAEKSTEKSIVNSSESDDGSSEYGKDYSARLAKAIIDSGAKIVLINAGDSFEMGDLHIRCLNPDKVSIYEGNDSSLVLAVKHTQSDFDMLFTGDISSDTEGKIIDRFREKSEYFKCDYLKIAHHGSRNSTSMAFLNEVNPKIAVISAGIDNSYGHPHVETLERLEDVNSIFFCTAKTGEVITLVGDDGKVAVKIIGKSGED